MNFCRCNNNELAARLARLEAETYADRYRAKEIQGSNDERFGRLIVHVGEVESRVADAELEQRYAHSRIDAVHGALGAYQRATTDLAALVEKAERFYKSYASLHKRIGQLDRVIRNHDLGLNTLNHLVASNDREARLRFDKVADKFAGIERTLRALRLGQDGAKKEGV